VDCNRMHRGFMLLPMNETIKWWFSMKSVFETILCQVLTFTQLYPSSKRLHSQYPILHQSSKSYYQPNEMCTIVTTQTKIWKHVSH
jgi:hypothetical protein